MPGGGPGEPADGLFDAAYRRVLEPFHPEEEARREAAALRDLLGVSQSDRILDLGCGWGRHLLLLRSAGHDVNGIDRSTAFLRDLRGEDGGATLAAGDMSALPVRDRVFDIVLNLATSLGLFLDEAGALAALTEARRVLRPGGRLLLEGMHRDDVVACFAARDQWTLDDGTVVRARRRFDALNGVSHEVLRWEGPAGAGGKRHSLRLRTGTEIGRLIESAGLHLQAVHGDWDGAPFRHTSPRLIMVAERL